MMFDEPFVGTRAPKPLATVEGPHIVDRKTKV